MATAQEIIDVFWRAARVTDTYRRLPNGLRRSHLYVLHAIDELGGEARVTDIAERALIRIPNVARLLRETDTLGLTVRRPHATDGRTTLVRLTDAGVACHDEYHRAYLERFEAALDPARHPEYDVMIAALDRALSVLERVTAEVDAELDRSTPPG